MENITILDNKIKDIEKSLLNLQKQYEENKKILDKLEPKVGQKRKRVWLGY